jgi:hypothetical protein
MIIRGITNPDRTDMTNPKVLTSRSLFVSGPCPRLGRRMEKDAVLVESFSHDFIVIAELKRR